MKRTIKTICIGIAVILPTGFAEARIGASPEECKAAYGTVTEARTDGGEITCFRNGVGTICRFRDGRCSKVNYVIGGVSIVDIAEYGKEPRFSKAQCMALLNLNRGASKWSQISKAQYGEDYYGIYATEDGKTRARISEVTVAVESVEVTELDKKGITDQAVTDAIASFSQDALDGPEIPQNAPLPPPTEEGLESQREELEAQRHAVEMEQTMQDLNQNQKVAQEASDKLQVVLDKIAARLAKRQEIEHHVKALAEIQKALQQSKNDADRITAREREEEWTATANRLAAEYEVLKEASAKGE